MPLTFLNQLKKTPYEIAHDKLWDKIDSNIGFDMNDLDITLNKSKIILKPSQASILDPDWKFYGYAMWPYVKADINEAFGHIGIKMYLDMPFNTEDVTAKMEQIFKIKMPVSDFEEKTIDDAPLTGISFVLKTISESVMWTGSLGLKIYPRPPGFDW